VAPWPDNTQVEQDLVLSRSLVELYRRPPVAEGLAFRGGTALQKLFCDLPTRYSEDLDFVQRDAAPIDPLIDEVRAALDPWLGSPKWKAGPGRFTLVYRFETTFAPTVTMRVKIEINTREHFTVCGYASRKFAVANRWFTGSADLTTYSLSELLGTKLRALYQRKKGSDLFDLALGLDLGQADAGEVVEVFEKYMHHGHTPVTRAQFEENMAAKIRDAGFLADAKPLLRTGIEHDPASAWERVHGALVARLSGEPWKGNQ
jgi:predicted nucleotidyltransferase component of viral defense system